MPRLARRLLGRSIYPDALVHSDEAANQRGRGRLTSSIRLIVALAAITAPLKSNSQEMCRYPILKEAHVFTITDTHGINSPDVKSLLAGRPPSIICEAVPGEAPTCSTPWGGKVYTSQCDAGRMCIQGMEDKQGRLVDFRNLYGNSMMQFPMFTDKRNGFGVYTCGQIEGLGVRIGEWYALEPELIGNMFSGLTYKIGADSRAYNATIQWRIIYGSPVSVNEGTKGIF